LRERNHLEDLGVDGDNIKINERSEMGRHGLDCCDSGWGQVTGCCECGNEPSGSIKWKEFLD